MHFDQTKTPYIFEQTIRYLQQPKLSLKDRSEIQEFFGEILGQQEHDRDYKAWKKMETFLFKVEQENFDQVFATLHKILNRKKLD